MPLSEYRKTEFSFEGDTKTVYRRGSGPGVVIMHEIPGLTPKVLEFANCVADAGFTVFLPSMLGTPGKPFSNSYAAKQIARACISREFRVLASNKSSPITIWIRALCRDVHAELGGPGVGALGMCLTGNFALSLMVDEAVMAPVLSQPSLPFAANKATKCGLHLSDKDLAAVKARTARGVSVLGLRFSNDIMCPKERFQRLKQELGDGFEAIEIDSSKGNTHGIKRTAHSVLTEDLIDKDGHPTQAALQRVLCFFEERLKRSNH